MAEISSFKFLPNFKTENFLFAPLQKLFETVSLHSSQFFQKLNLPTLKSFNFEPLLTNPFFQLLKSACFSYGSLILSETQNQNKIWKEFGKGNLSLNGAIAKCVVSGGVITGCVMYPGEAVFVKFVGMVVYCLLDSFELF